jgi:hypothetical protein
VTIKTARAALSNSVFTGISRNHLDQLVTELAEPFTRPGRGGCTAAVVASSGAGPVPDPPRQRA